jgi:integrase
MGRGRGSIRRRGKRSWQIRFDDGTDAAGRRKARWATVRGTRQDAQRELTRLLAAADAGTLPKSSKVTLAEHVRGWLREPQGLSPKTRERYQQLAEQQIIPHLGTTPLQKLKPAHVHAWHGTLLTSGGKEGKALSARTVITEFSTGRCRSQ